MSVSDFVSGHKESPSVSGKLKKIGQQPIHGESTTRDSATSSIRGLNYSIEAIKNRQNYYEVVITGWRYSIHHETHEFPILSFQCENPATFKKSKRFLFGNIKVKSRSLISTVPSSQRALMAALFLIKQIEKGQVPDANRILRLYKIHPSQHSLYDMD